MQHVVIDIVRLVDAFIVFANASPIGPVGYLSNTSQWTFVARQYVFTMQTLLGDGVIVCVRDTYPPIRHSHHTSFIAALWYGNQNSLWYCRCCSGVALVVRRPFCSG